MTSNSNSSTLSGVLLNSCDPCTSNDYWNLDDILAEEERVPCDFKVRVRGINNLEQITAAAV